MSDMQWKIPVSLLQSPMLTKRELFAAMALQGLLASGDPVKEATELAIYAADDLIKKLNQKPVNPPGEGQS